MNLRAEKDGGLTLLMEGAGETHYSRVNRNQLVMCARMNNWDRFIAMWEKKTDSSVWPAIRTYFETLNSTNQWKLKETFARLETIEDEQIEETTQPEIPIPLP